MKTNAFTQGRVRLLKVWGDTDSPHMIEVDPGTKVFVCYAPILKQWVASITHIDYRYDSIVQTSDFLIDSNLLPVVGSAEGASYYLNRMRSKIDEK